MASDKKPMGGGKKGMKGSVDNPAMSEVYKHKSSGSGVDSCPTMDREQTVMPAGSVGGKKPDKGPVFK